MLSIPSHCYCYDIIHVSNLAMSLCDTKLLAAYVEEVLCVIEVTAIEQVCLSTSSFKEYLYTNVFPNLVILEREELTLNSIKESY